MSTSCIPKVSNFLGTATMTLLFAVGAVTTVAFAQAPARERARYDLPAHWHASAERMVLVSGELQVTYDGQAPVDLEPGMYAYGPSKAVHRGRCVSDEPCVPFIAFEGPVGAAPVAAADR